MTPERQPIPSRPGKRAGSLATSFRHAYEGLVHTVVCQRNMKIHVVSAILVGLVGSGLVLDLASKVILLFCVLFVFFAEILNTALEALVDLHIERFDERARVTKDAAAAGVLVLAIGTMAIFAAVLITHWPAILASGERIVRQIAFGAPLAGLAAFLLCRAPRPAWVDWLATIAGAGLLLLLVSWSSSSVMSAMVIGLFSLSSVSARRARQLRAQAGANAAAPGSPVAGSPEA